MSVVFSSCVATGVSNAPVHQLKIRQDERPIRLHQVAQVGEVTRVNIPEPPGFKYRYFVLEDISDSEVLTVVANNHA